MASMFEASDNGVEHMSVNEMNESLFESIMKGRIDRVRSLLRKGADVNARYYINVKTRKILGGEDANVDTTDTNVHYDTALFLGSRLGHSKVVSALLKHDDVDGTGKDKLGRTALTVAAHENIDRMPKTSTVIAASM
ncbi:hypothetical protein MHU86_14218 [Fragilaria crotonensis]|nr:hypothetical protein MHU86_14218 [Fragilaria crotonensis]